MSLLKTSRKMLCFIYIGPLVVYKIIDKYQYILMDNEGKIMNGACHLSRLKKAFLRIKKGLVSTLADLKQIINLAIAIREQS